MLKTEKLIVWNASAIPCCFRYPDVTYVRYSKRVLAVEALTLIFLRLSKICEQRYPLCGAIKLSRMRIPSLKQLLITLALTMMITGCQALGRTDVQGTLQANTIFLETESAAANATVRAEQLNVFATAQAAATIVSGYRNVNQQLLATVDAGSTAVPQVIAGGGDIFLEPTAAFVIASGGRWFVKTGISETVRASDGCVENARDIFPVSVPRVYATLRAYNIQAGTPLRADWYRDTELVWQENLTVSSNFREVCFWFELTREQAEFTPGGWSVRLFGDGFQLENPVNFFFTDM